MIIELQNYQIIDKQRGNSSPNLTLRLGEGKLIICKDFDFF